MALLLSVTGCRHTCCPSSSAHAEGTRIYQVRGVIREIKDDGRGVDWDRVRARARAAGLPHASHQELVDALFSDGFSTRDTAGDLSGRGVGLGALRAAAWVVTVPLPDGRTLGAPTWPLGDAKAKRGAMPPMDQWASTWIDAVLSMVDTTEEVGF